MKTMIEKIKKILFKKDNVSSVTEFSNQYLMDKMERVFTQILERDSYDDRLLFDCDYLIMLPTEVYNRLVVNSQIIIDGIIKRFYKVIKEKKEGKEYIPLSKNWCIQFVAKNFSTDNNEEEVITVISNPVPINWSNAKEQDLQKVSVNGKHSSYSNLNINELLFSNVNMLQKGTGTVRFNPNLEVSSIPNTTNQNTNTEEETPTDALAVINFIENGKFLKFTMKKNELTIGKAKNGELATEDYLPVETDDRGLKINHFIIKYNSQERGFSIAVFAPTRVNEEPVPISRSSSNLTWKPLTQKSAILCGMTQFDFKVL